MILSVECHLMSYQNLFGSTEIGFFMFTTLDGTEGSRLFRRVSDVFTAAHHELRPIASEAESEAGTQSSTRLLEVVVLPESPDCPTPALRQADGAFHTGDLFEEVLPGRFASRGRDDDWIKSENSLRCDTKYVLISGFLPSH
jgi:acyl-coenzyme A synthetase/AMP-(fatty) acid ligase